MNIFDLIAPIYEMIHIGAKNTFLKITKLGDFHEEDRMLDIGGGSGRIAKFFVGAVEEITVVDPSEGMIKKCKTHDGLNCILASAEKLPFAGDYFDKAIIIDAWHHFENHKQVVKETARVLKPGGKIVIEEFNRHYFLMRLVERAEILLGTKSRFFTPNSLAALFKDCGFKVRLIGSNNLFFYLIGEKVK